MMTGRASSSMILLILQALCFRHDSDLDTLSDSMHEKYAISSIRTRVSLREEKKQNWKIPSLARDYRIS